MQSVYIRLAVVRYVGTVVVSIDVYGLIAAGPGGKREGGRGGSEWLHLLNHTGKCNLFTLG